MDILLILGGWLFIVTPILGIQDAWEAYTRAELSYISHIKRGLLEQVYAVKLVVCGVVGGGALYYLCEWIVEVML